MDITPLSSTPAVHRPHGGETVRRASPPEDRSVQPESQDTTPSASPRTITKEEKEFFEQLFPAAAPEIRVYQVYSRTGGTTAALAGTVIDRKG